DRYGIRALAGFGLQPDILRYAFAHETPRCDGNGVGFQPVRNRSIGTQFAITENICLANLAGDLRANVRQIILPANRRDALALLDVRAKNFVVDEIRPGFGHRWLNELNS